MFLKLVSRSMMIKFSELSFLFAGRIYPFGWKIIGVSFVLCIISWIIYVPIGIFFLILTFGIIYFFRDPERIPPLLPQSIVSPADGLVVEVCQAKTPKNLPLSEQTWTKVSIFLSITDVHVNRSPAEGIVTYRSYQKGKFCGAFKKESGEQNERLSLIIKLPSNKEIICTQIAGFIARRIVCCTVPSDPLFIGQRYGIICFGSRMELYVPKSYEVLVRQGQRMIAGETLIAFSKDEKALN